MNYKNTGNSVLSEIDIINYVFERFENLKKEPTINKLVIFHTNNKLLLMSHNQESLRILGNIVANHKKNTLKKIIKNYEVNLRAALSTPATTSRHVNVLMHIFGHFSNDFDSTQKRIFLDLLEQFRDENISLGTTLWKIDPLIYQYNKEYLIGQTYFSLYAEKLPWNLYHHTKN